MSKLDGSGPLTPRTLIALVIADIDIKLLCEEDQETDKQQTFTVAQIRRQLEATAQLVVDVLYSKIDIDRPLRGMPSNILI